GYHTPLNKKLVELVHKVEKSKKFLTTEEFLEKTKNLIPRQTKEDQEKINTPFARLKLTVIKVEGDCYHGYKKGDEIILEDFTHPPKFFCLGLAHVLFPVIYALSFGAKFPFSQNQRSLEVTCPDGGKLSFKVEIFDKEGRLENIPKDPNYKGPQPKEMILEVVKSKGNCSYGYKVGDKFKVVGLRCPEGFCGAAYHCAFPALFALNFGAKFFFMDEPNSIDTVTCPDGGKIVFKVARQDA
ncbi:MAG: TIGR04076 family protein, partial [Candidatus Omnitrophica bacterium]|nr:TIGR04076 family protein [Candidatus Omnitrophota bacterium]